MRGCMIAGHFLGSKADFISISSSFALRPWSSFTEPLLNSLCFTLIFLVFLKLSSITCLEQQVKFCYV